MAHLLEAAPWNAPAGPKPPVPEAPAEAAAVPRSPPAMPPPPCLRRDGPQFTYLGSRYATASSSSS
jgi:hypothetical protein